MRWVGFSQVLNPMTSVLISDRREDKPTEKRTQKVKAEYDSK